MSALFILDVETEAEARRVTLRLGDAEGRHLEAWEVELGKHRLVFWSGLFDTRRQVERMRDLEEPAAQLAELGGFLGEHVLGPGISRKLAEGVGQRTVIVRLGDPSKDPLAADFARVPWEIARAPGDRLTLLERNVVVRAAPAGATPVGEAAVAVEEGKPVRVLLVFAEAPGARPLAARLERERLLDLFFTDVLPLRNVEVDVLCHGVTRRRLQEQVRARGGYHVVHWSGHGKVDALEVALDEGEKSKPEVSGGELVDLFRHAGGFIPSVFFLGACESGSLGLTGTGLALVRAGVKQVVAMRYEVGDRYARRLARRFYRGLLVDSAHHAVDAALLLARTELARDMDRKGEYDVVDHATPLVFGAEPVRIEPGRRKSGQMERRGPRPQPLLPSGSKELDPPRGFVGRGDELTRLWREWLAPEGAAVALIQGLAGLGKTSLAAEVIHLWFGRFDYVLCFQAKGGVLGVEELYRRLDQRLALASPSYRERCKDNAMARIYLAPEPSLTGEIREEALRNNLVDALGNERILLVLDNFETNLLTGGKAQDPAWDRLLEDLGDRLRGTGSRVLVTSRHKVAALSKNALRIPLGPLPREEARIFFEGQPSIRELLYGDDDAKRLARRILDISRGHPLILGRIADMARAHYVKGSGLTEKGREALDEALEKIQGQGFKMLPDVFVGVKTEAEREKERAYLEDVAIGAVDLLIERLSKEGRRLLWVVTRAGESTIEEMIAGVWGESPAGLLGELCGTGLLVQEGETYSFHELVAERAAEWMIQRPGERGSQTEAEVWTTYGEQYGALFHALVGARKRDQASEAGSRGIRFLVRACAFESLRAFASDMVIGTRDPVLLGQVVADLQGAATEAPEGRERWRLRMYMADALGQAGWSDQALPLYAQAAEAAEAAEAGTDLAWIYHNWAQALQDVGQLNRARETYLRSAEAQRRGGRPRVDIVMSELAALQIDVQQGRPQGALPAIEAKLGELRGWWARQGQSKPAPEAPDGEALARTLLGGLDIAREANHGLERWQVCLDLLGEMKQMESALGTGEHELAMTRFNSYYPLMKLERTSEAKTVLEDCLHVYRHAGDITNEARALTALADILDELGDPAQALLLERRALAVHERMPHPGDRAASHQCLSIYLRKTGATGEAIDHQLAALIYILVTGHDPRINLTNLTNRIRESAARNELFTFPPLTTLLAAPAFAPLRAYLTERNADLPALQTRIDQLVNEARASLPPPIPPE